MKAVVVDTNVAVVANARSTHASPACVIACAERLRGFTSGRSRVALDSGNLVFDQYRNHLSLSGQPGVGDLFMRWVHDNLFNTARCERVSVTPLSIGNWRAFAEVPDDPELAGFDRDDQVFVAVAKASPSNPSILNAVDSDWWDYELVLGRNGVKVNHVCRDQVAAWKQERMQRGGTVG